MKKCADCGNCYCPDETDVSGFGCRKNHLIKITDTAELPLLCPGYEPNCSDIVEILGAMIIGLLIIIGSLYIAVLVIGEIIK
jgi:hypothetical protein